MTMPSNKGVVDAELKSTLDALRAGIAGAARLPPSPSCRFNAIPSIESWRGTSIPIPRSELRPRC